MMTSSSDSLYLDHAAATPLDPKVLEAMLPYFSDYFYNPSATYQPAIEVKASLQAARSQIAMILGVRSSELVFTAGGSESNNLSIHGVMRSYLGSNLVVSSVEHESVLKPSEDYPHQLIAVKPDGQIDLDDLKAKIDDQTVLVSVMYANNEVGTIEPLKDVAALLSEIKAARKASGNNLPLLLHSDGAQAANYLDLNVKRLGLDLMSLNGGKIYGPKQSGALFIRAGVSLKPLVSGGGQERGLRSGTESVANAVGLAAALQAAQDQRKTESKRLANIQAEAYKLIETKLPLATINGSTHKRLPNNLHFSLDGQDNERLLIGLENLGILAAAGSACSASNELPSHVLKAMGLSDELARSSIRLTMGRTTTLTDIERTIDGLGGLLA